MVYSDFLDVCQIFFDDGHNCQEILSMSTENMYSNGKINT